MTTPNLEHDLLTFSEVDRTILRRVVAMREEDILRPLHEAWRLRHIGRLGADNVRMWVGALRVWRRYNTRAEG